jgi:molybdenum cofactor biosynthesis protein B
MGTQAHKEKALKMLNIGVFSMSSTRSLSEDKSGLWIVEQTKTLGHTIVCHEVIADDRQRIISKVKQAIHQHNPHALLLTGGTGISPKDVTIEAIKPLFDKELTAFAALFANLSFQEIGAAAMLSRAMAGIIGKTVVFCMPGSLKACQLACSNLIFPEIGHLSAHLIE